MPERSRPVLITFSIRFAPRRKAPIGAFHTKKTPKMLESKNASTDNPVDATREAAFFPLNSYFERFMYRVFLTDLSYEHSFLCLFTLRF